MFSRPNLNATRPVRRAVAAGAALTMLALLAGCGGAASTTTHEAGTSQRTAETHRAVNASASAPHGGFVANADAVCAKADAQARHLTVTVSLGKEFAEFFTRFLTIARERNSALEGLVPPASEQGEYANLMRLETAEYRHDVESEKATLEHDTALEARLNKETTLPEERGRAYTALGLSVCNGPKI